MSLIITNLNKDKEINKTENPNKEILFRKKNPKWEFKKQIPNGNKRFPKRETIIIDIDYEGFTDLLKIQNKYISIGKCLNVVKFIK